MIKMGYIIISTFVLCIAVQTSCSRNVEDELFDFEPAVVVTHSTLGKLARLESIPRGIPHGEILNIRQYEEEIPPRNHPNIAKKTRTIEDVLDSFEPAFVEVHNAISKLESIAHNEGKRQYSEIYTSNTRGTANHLNALQSTTGDIARQIHTIVEDSGMSSHVDLIQHCSAKGRTDVDTLVKSSNCMVHVCFQLIMEGWDKLNVTLNDYYNKQNQWHKDVDGIKQSCSINKTPFEYQNCLIEQLYLNKKPFLEDMAHELSDFIRANDKFVQIIISELASCYTIASEKTISDRIPIVDDFRKCVAKAAESIPVLNNKNDNCKY